MANVVLPDLGPSSAQTPMLADTDTADHHHWRTLVAVIAFAAYAYMPGGTPAIPAATAAAMHRLQMTKHVFAAHLRPIVPVRSNAVHSVPE